ncbi:MAG: transcription elongation factor GreB [Proteobacteria bacterium]|nr:transcription elongation factor GreB [Pseudomonadota bacterium]
MVSIAVMVHRRPGSGPRSSYITPEGAKRLRDELSHLWSVERPKVTQEVADAAAQGDRSENAEYIYGKKRLREIDRRLQFLSRRLDELTVVEPKNSIDGSVRFGAWVEVEDEDGAAAEYRLVGPDEFDASKGWISIDSPVGRALLGKKVDDEVTVRRPKGEIVYTILSVRYEPGEQKPKRE